MSNGESHELAAERRGRIREALKLQGAVRVDDLAERLGVSAATVRRDLADLEKAGDLRRVHGGAIPLGGRLEEPLFDDKTGIAEVEKLAIAKEALALISPDESIYLDGGSTVLNLARMLSGMTSLTVVTNSLHVASALSGKGPRLIMVGGELRRRSQTFVGALTEAVINRLHVDKAFMGTIGMSVAEGLTTTDPNEAMTKQLIVAHADQVILLANSGKVGKVAFAKVGDIEGVDLLVTDKAVDAGFVKQLQKRHIKVIKA